MEKNLLEHAFELFLKSKGYESNYLCQTQCREDEECLLELESNAQHGRNLSRLTSFE